jgi:hypothetical protein
VVNETRQYWQGGGSKTITVGPAGAYFIVSKPGSDDYCGITNTTVTGSYLYAAPNTTVTISYGSHKNIEAQNIRVTYIHCD